MGKKSWREKEKKDKDKGRKDGKGEIRKREMATVRKEKEN